MARTSIFVNKNKCLRNIQRLFRSRATATAAVKLCIVHMVRHSLNYVSWKRRPEVAADLKHIYPSATADEAEQRLGEFEAKWDAEYLPIGQSWRHNWLRA